MHPPRLEGMASDRGRGADGGAGASPDELAELRRIVADARRLVFFGGAGVSTESGIPDFRSANGLYSQRYRRDLRPEEIVSAEFLAEDPETFFDFYREHLVYPDARPNAAHRIAARWEVEGRCLGVVTQNIDGLHQRAGSRRVAELHGSTLRNHCIRCGARYDRDFVTSAHGIPRCPRDAGMVRPDVVLYGEPLDDGVLEEATGWMRGADVLLVAGTSLAVYPAAGLLQWFGGDTVVVINLSPTPFDAAASLEIHAPVGATLAAAFDDA